MTKKLDEEAIRNELKGASLFFRPPAAASAPPVPADDTVGEPEQPVAAPPPPAGELPVVRPVEPPAPAPPQPAADAAAVPLDLGELPYRKASFLFTDREFDALDDLKLALRRELDARVTKEDLARCAVAYMVAEFKRRGATSPVFTPLKKRRGR